MKYFLHDTSASDDEKITELYLKHGYEGTGLFYAALEKIGKQEKPIKTEILKSQLRIGKHLEKVWNFIEEIGLISSTNGESFSEQLLNYAQSYEIRREKTREKVSQWRKRQEDKKNVTGYVPVSNPPKVKESKVNKNKRKEIYKESDFLTKIISTFQEIYFEIFQTEYIITNIGKERSAAGKILKVYKDKNPDSDSEKSLKDFKDFFLSCCSVRDNWLRDNVSIPNIHSKINEYKTQIKNGGNSKIRSVASRSAEIEGMVNAVADAKGLQ
jgi:hypothetical protein